MMDSAVIIGCGLIGHKRAWALRDRGVRIDAVYDVDTDAARRLSDALDDRPSVAGSLGEAVERNGVRLVVVATAHRSLVPCALAAVRAGHAVLVEKPGADSYGEMQKLVAAATARGTTVRVGFNHRFHPSVRAARDLIRSGQYGPLMNIRGRYGHGGRVGYEKEWRADRAISGGGELLDQGVHLIDLTRLFAGDVDLAFSEVRTDFWDMDVEDNAFLALRCRSGGFAWLHVSWTEWKNLFSIEVALRDAKVEITGLGGSYGTERLALYAMRPEMGPPDTTIWEWPRPDDSWAAEIDDILGELDGDASVGAGLADASEALRIVAEAYHS